MSLPTRMLGSRILAVSREDLDPSSTGSVLTDFVSYALKGREHRLGVFEVKRVGPGKIVLGLQEQIDVKEGDLVLLNLRDCDNWITFEGKKFAQFEYFNVMATLSETEASKARRANKPAFVEKSLEHLYKAQYTIQPLQNFVLLERDDEAMTKHTLSPVLRQMGTVLDDVVLTDGYISDDEKSNKFPQLYMRVVSKGPGKKNVRFNADLGVPEVYSEDCDVEAGAVVMVGSTHAHCRFRFYNKNYSMFRGHFIQFEV